MYFISWFPWKITDYEMYDHYSIKGMELNGGRLLKFSFMWIGIILTLYRLGK